MSDEHTKSNLIITDNQSLALTVQQALSRLGESGPSDRVLTFEDAGQALESYSATTGRVLVALGDDTSRGLATVRMVRESISVPLFVVGPRDAGLILDAVHAGADSFIEDFDPLDEYLARALARPRANGKATSDGKLICVSSVRGGSGGSVLAVNLAMAFAQRMKRAALCDFDFQDGVCDAMLNVRPKHTILDLLGRGGGLDRNSIDSAMTRHSSGVHLLSAPSKAIDDRSPLEELCQRVIRTIRPMFPVTVVDFPRFNASLGKDFLLSACNKLVLVTQLDFNSIRSTRRALDYLERIGVPPQRILIVGNRDGQPHSLATSHAEEALNFKIPHVIPDDPKIINRSVNCGSPFYATSTGTPLGKKLDQLAATLLGVPKNAQATASPNEATAPRTTKSTESLLGWVDWLMSRLTDNDAIL